MKFKSRSGPKIPTTQKNTNKKKEVDIAATPKPENNMSLIKKNEFALILLGALILTMVVFFVFFKSSDSSKAIDLKNTTGQSSSVNLEERIQILEKKIDALSNTPGMDKNEEGGKAELLAQRVSRLEAAFAVKFDSVIERMAGIEKTLAQLKANSAKLAATPVVQKKVAKTPPKKTSTVAAKSAAKKGVFHTVQKKETLYSISKKYNTTVAALRKLNNLSQNATIYPGDNILVK
jgi:LysM repeat protein